MFTSVIVQAILSVLQWVFLIVAGLYLMASVSIALRQDDGLAEVVLMAVIAILASGVIRFFRQRLTPKSRK